jgi:alkylation response protein AidB-like acyl-CoA dehydrogenase
MTRFRFELCRLPPAAESLREEIRAFLAEHLADYPRRRRAYTWTGWDEDFSRRVAERGWIGLTWPTRYGGGERSAFERYVVCEEMLAAGAPVAAHWVGDRQSGPLLLRFGTEAQRQAILPGVCRGEIFFCIGMSEPDTGSDLASIRSRAERVDGGWRLQGTKLWTTGAQHCQYMVALFRTAPAQEERHAGLSQFLVPLRTPGITVRPIRDLAGNEHFGEVTFEDAVIPEDALVGREGDGWAQVMAELAFERSGPERYLSCHPLLTELVGVLGATPSRDAPSRDAPGRDAQVAVGRQVAHLATLRAMSISVAGLLEAGENPALEAALVKDVGGVFEQNLPGVAQALVDREPRTDAGAGPFESVLAELTQNAPSFSLRGGTREILRGIIARGLGLR